MDNQELEIYERIAGIDQDDQERVQHDQEIVSEPYDLEEGLAAEAEILAREPENKKSGFMKGFFAGLTLGVVLLVCVSTLIIVTMHNSYSAQMKRYAATHTDYEGLLNEVSMSKISIIEKLLRDEFLFEYDTDALLEGVYAGMLRSVGDTYTQYYDKEATEDLKLSNTGKYEGVGATLTQNLQNMTISITRIYEDSPANDAGLKIGDVILKVDDLDITGMELSEAVRHIRGEEGTTVMLTIYRDGETQEIEVERRHIEVEYVEYEMLEGNIGHISILQFGEVTADQFKAALEDLTGQGMESVIFDLRDNPGGLLDVCCTMVDELLPEGLIVYTEDKNGEVKEYNSTGEDSFDLPMVILVNGNSASASEIFTGALKDRVGATVIGTNTFGKGIVQSVVPLTDGTTVKLTTSEYFTPNGTKIHGVGIAPDVEVEDEKDKDGEKVDRTLDKALEILGADR